MPHPLKPTRQLRIAAAAALGVYILAIVVLLLGLVYDDPLLMLLGLGIGVVGIAVDLRRLASAGHVRTTQLVLLWQEGSLEGVPAPVIPLPRDGTERAQRVDT